ncbi:homoserine O- acetyltransferase [Agyrium rufum]|nr:homoserine O- acetyltransferase [Agyrium rufum]
MANDQDFSKKDDYEDLASEIDPKEMTEGVKQKQGFSRPHTSIPKAWGSPYADSSGMAGPIVAKGGVLTSEEIAYWSQRRDEMIARGEDPERVSSQPENPFAKFVESQEIAILPTFTLESGAVLHNAPIAYTKRGKLSKNKDNALVICHALTGSADVSDWWGPLMGGGGRAFDITRFFVVCLNSLGSPYGSASPVTNRDGDPALGIYGPEFPLTTIRDDVRAHKMVLDDLGVRSLAAVVGGSMGGMLALEYAYFGAEYVRNVVAIATSSKHSAWCISWGEAQRQAIYSDPKYDDGFYKFSDPPSAGLSAARMSALLTYRSRDSFESRFGRATPNPMKAQTINAYSRPGTPTSEHLAVHNDGHRSSRSLTQIMDPGFSSKPTTITTTTATLPSSPLNSSHPPNSTTTPRSLTPVSPTNGTHRRGAPTYFSAQSYLRYQGQKFIDRFDSNCYIAITRKLDTHDVSRDRIPDSDSDPDAIRAALALITQPTLVLGIGSDGLFTFAEQQELAAGITNSTLGRIESPEGHDAFLLQFEQVNRLVLEFFWRYLPEIMGAPRCVVEGLVLGEGGGEEEGGVGVVTKTSTFGEAEVEDITAW